MVNLDDGALYRFRVMAVNAAGESDPANLKEPIRVQDRLGELSFQWFSNIRSSLRGTLCIKSDTSNDNLSY